MIKSRRLRDAVAVGLLVLFAAAGVLAQEPQVEEPQVVIVESTNSLLVNATAEQHLQVATIISYVDSVPEAAAIPYVVYPLENQDPVELADVLNRLVMETSTSEEKGAKIVTTTKKLEEDIIIIPDSKTYSLIVYASKKNQQWISSLIKTLDEYRAQVLLDVTLVEISKNDEFMYDLDMISQIAPGADAMKFFPQTGFLSAFPNHIIAEAVSTGAELGEYKDAGGKGYFANEQVQALLKIMQYKGYGRILARPKLLVNDNQEGTIKTEEKTYVAKTQTSYIPTTAGASTAGYAAQTSVSFDPYQAGIELKIQPHISKGDQLQLNITLDRTDFSKEVTTTKIGGVEYTAPKDTTSSNIQTVVTVPDDKTIILGGLEKVDQTKGGGKIPLLGDIPLIGGLFRNVSNASTQSRLYVFVKAHILRPGEFTGASDVEIVSAKNRAKFERYEEEMQRYENWPGIKPKPMDPVQVLEAD